MKTASLLTKEQLEKLPNKRLLAYKNKLMRVPESPSWEEDNVDRVNKTDKKWQDTYSAVKDVLSKRREHVER